MAGKTEVKGKLFFAYPNDVVYSKIDVRNGAIGIISETGEKMVFSSEYPIYKVDTSVALPQYIRLLFRTAHFQNHINSLISGASGRKLIEPSILEQIEVPLPTIQKQKEIIVPYIKASETVAAATECLVKTIKEVDEIILGRRTLPIILQ